MRLFFHRFFVIIEFFVIKLDKYQKIIIQLFSRNSRSLRIAIFSIHPILFPIFFFSSFYVESNFMKNGQSTVCRLARRKSSRKIFPATPWRTVLLGRFHNFPRNRVRFKGTTHPTMKLLALSAEIPSLENLYIYSSFCTLWMKLRYNFCRYPLSKSVYDKSPSRFSTSFQAFESS